ncbi:MAG: hypothetical protein U0165_17930 [Polyangiaceae bacterium]
MPWVTAISLPLLFAAMSASAEQPAAADVMTSVTTSVREVAQGSMKQAAAERASSELRVVRWKPIRTVGLPDAEVIDAFGESSPQVASLGLGVGVSSMQPPAGARPAERSVAESTTSAEQAAPKPRAEIEAQVDATRSRPSVELHLTPLGSLGERTTASIMRDETTSIAWPAMPVVMRPLGRFEGGFVLSDKGRKAAGWTLVGGGSASGALATYFAVMGSQRESGELVHDPANCKATGCRSMTTNRPDSRAVSSALGGAGIAVLATGGLFLMTTPALSFGQRTRVGAAVRSTNAGFLVMTGEW